MAIRFYLCRCVDVIFGRSIAPSENYMYVSRWKFFIPSFFCSGTFLFICPLWSILYQKSWSFCIFSTITYSFSQSDHSVDLRSNFELEVHFRMVRTRSFDVLSCNRIFVIFSFLRLIFFSRINLDNTFYSRRLLHIQSTIIFMN